MTRRLLVPAAALAAALVVTLGAAAGNGTPINPHSKNALTLAVIGDVPYGADQVAAFPEWVEAINGDPKVDLAVHLGDIKNGSTRCDDSYFDTIASDFAALKDPLVYTPGDNEWTDCHRANNGAYNPLERLAAIHQTFFTEPGITLGGREKQVVAQPGYPENVLWTQSEAVFAALHVVGSNNSLAPWSGLGMTSPTPEQLAEASGRIAAALEWVDAAFDAAEASGAAGVVLMMQADTFQGDNETLAGFASIVDRIEERAGAFAGPVLLLQGDSHVYTEDHPLAGAPNLTRIVVHGETLPGEYLRLTVDPRAVSLFTWERVGV
jgi:hypothetical protein